MVPFNINNSTITNITYTDIKCIFKLNKKFLFTLEYKVLLTQQNITKILTVISMITGSNNNNK